MASGGRLAALFYEIRAKTEGLQSDLLGAERQLGKFSAFVAANPVAAFGALGAASLAAAAKAVQASEQIEQSFRRISSALPTGANLDPLRDTVRDLAHEFGVSRSAILQSAEANAVYSKSADELVERTKAVVLAQQAGKGDAVALAAQYDQVADAFNLTGAAASEAFARVIEVSKGANSAADTFASLQKAAPALQTLGISLDTALRALVTINERGLSPKQAGAYFDKLAAGGAEGARIMRELAAATPTVTNALAQLQKDADTAGAGIARSTGQIKASIEDILVTVGSRLAPFVAEQLSILNAQLAELGGDTGPKAARAVKAILGATDGEIAGQFALTKQTFDRLLSGFEQLTSKSIKNLGGALRSESDASLAKLATQISRLKVSELTSPEDAQNAQRLLDLILKIQQERNLAATLQSRISGAKGAGLPDAPKSLAEQQAAAEKAIKLRAELDGLLRDSDQLSQKGIGGDAFRQFVDDAEKAKTKLKEFAALNPKLLGADALAAALAKLNAAVARERDTSARELLGELDKQVAALTSTKLDDFLLQIEEQNRKTRDAITNSKQLTDAERTEALAKQAQVEALQQQAAGAIRATESVESLFRAIDQRSSDGFLSPQELKDSLSEIDNLHVSLAALLGSLTPDSSAYLAVQKLILDIEQKRLAVNKEFTQQNPFKIPESDIAQEKRDDNERIARQLRLVQTINDAAGAALSLARAFGVVNDATAKVASSIIDIGTGLARALSGDIVGGTLQAVKGLTDLISDAVLGPMEKRIQRLKNDETNFSHIAEEKKNAGDLIGSNVTGNEFTSLSKALDSLLSGKGGDFRRVGNINGFFEQFGISGDRMQAIAKSLGITLDGSVGAFRRLNEAIKALDLDAFGKGFDGAMHRIDLLDHALGNVAPIDQLLERIAVLTGPDGAPALAKALDGLDLTTEGGRTDAIAALIEQLKHVADLKPEDLGGLTLDEFTQQILDTIDRLRALNPAALSPLEAFQQRLKILTDGLEASGADAAERLKRLTEFFVKEFPKQLAGITPASSIADVRRQFLAFLGGAGSDGQISDDEQAIIDAFTAIIAAMNAAADAAGTVKSQAEQDAAAARASEINRVKQGLTLSGTTDPAKVQEALLAAYEKAIPKLGDILGHTAGDTLQEKFSEIFKELNDGTIAADSLGVPLDEFIAALLDIVGASTQATSAVTGLADTLAGAFNEIDLDARIAGDTIETSIGKKLAAIGIGGEVTDDAGRQKAIADLQALAAANQTDDKLKSLIADLLDSIRGLTNSAAPLGGGAAGGGSTSAVANAAQNLTETTGNRMADYLATGLILDRARNDKLDRIVSAVSGFIGASLASSLALPKLSPPSLSESFGAGLSGGANAVTVNLGGVDLGGITINTAGGVEFDAVEALVERIDGQVLRRLATKISRILSGDVVNARRLAGQVSG